MTRVAKIIWDALLVSLILLLGSLLMWFVFSGFEAKGTPVTPRAAFAIGIAVGMWALYWLLVNDLNPVEAAFSMIYLVPIATLVMMSYSANWNLIVGFLWNIWPFKLADDLGVDSYTLGLMALAYLCVCIANAFGAAVGEAPRNVIDWWHRRKALKSMQ